MCMACDHESNNIFYAEYGYKLFMYPYNSENDEYSTYEELDIKHGEALIYSLAFDQKSKKLVVLDSYGGLLILEKGNQDNNYYVVQ